MASLTIVVQLFLCPINIWMFECCCWSAIAAMNVFAFSVHLLVFIAYQSVYMMLGRSLQCDQNSENRTIVDTAWPFFLNWRKTLPLHTMPTIHTGCKNCVNANEWIGVTGWIHFSMLCTSNNNLCKHKFRMQMDDDSQWYFFSLLFLVASASVCRFVACRLHTRKCKRTSRENYKHKQKTNGWRWMAGPQNEKENSVLTTKMANANRIQCPEFTAWQKWPNIVLGSFN